MRLFIYVLKELSSSGSIAGTTRDSVFDGAAPVSMQEFDLYCQEAGGPQL